MLPLQVTYFYCQLVIATFFLPFFLASYSVVFNRIYFILATAQHYALIYPYIVILVFIYILALVFAHFRAHYGLFVLLADLKQYI